MYAFKLSQWVAFLMKEIWKLQKELKGLNEYLKTNVINEIDPANLVITFVS